MPTLQQRESILDFYSLSFRRVTTANSDHDSIIINHDMRKSHIANDSFI